MTNSPLPHKTNKLMASDIERGLERESVGSLNSVVTFADDGAMTKRFVNIANEDSILHIFGLDLIEFVKDGRNHLTELGQAHGAPKILLRIATKGSGKVFAAHATARRDKNVAIVQTAGLDIIHVGTEKRCGGIKSGQHEQKNDSGFETGRARNDGPVTFDALSLVVRNHKGEQTIQNIQTTRAAGSSAMLNGGPLGPTSNTAHREMADDKEEFNRRIKANKPLLASEYGWRTQIDKTKTERKSVDVQGTGAPSMVPRNSFGSRTKCSKNAWRNG